MLTELRQAFDALSLPCSIKVLAVSLFSTLLVLLSLGFAAQTLIIQSGIIDNSWLAWGAGWGSLALIVIGGMFLFPVLSTAVSSLFLEDLANELERPLGVSPARAISLGEQIRAGLRTLFYGLGLNLLALPFYLIPMVNLVVFVLLNGTLLGREYYELVTLRHLSAGETRALRKRRKLWVFQRGVLIAALFMIPGVNLLAPVLGTALMTYGLWQKDTGPLRQRLALAPSNVLPNRA